MSPKETQRSYPGDWAMRPSQNYVDEGVDTFTNGRVRLQRGLVDTDQMRVLDTTTPAGTPDRAIWIPHVVLADYLESIGYRVVDPTEPGCRSCKGMGEAGGRDGCIIVCERCGRELGCW